MLLVGAFAATAAAQPPDGYGVSDGALDTLSPLQRAGIQSRLARSLAQVDAIAPRPARAVAAVTLGWPLRPTATFDGLDYWGVSNFVDHDQRAPGHVLDYACGTRSYDTAAPYNHAGTDYFLWPFPWAKMDAGQVAVVAAAQGVLVDRFDGRFDRSCAMGDAQWNAAFVRHDDGSVAWYGHLKTGSVTTKQPGEHIDAGEMLGLVGSSGSSTGPHLHFELHDATGAVVDPRHGDCNPEPERWAVPQAYEMPALLQLSLHDAPPEQVSCGVQDGVAVHEVTHRRDALAPGMDFVVFAAYRDHRVGAPTQFRLRQPDGTLYAQWNYDLAELGLPRPFYAATYAQWHRTLGADAARGTWTLEADFAGTTRRTEFAVGSVDDARRGRVQAEGARVGTLARPSH